MRQGSLCVDFNRALVLHSYLAEALLAALRNRPLLVFLLPFWLLKGRSYFAQCVYKHGYPDPALLPYNREIISALHARKEAGHSLFLACNLPSDRANEIAAHLGIFDRTLSHADLGIGYDTNPLGFLQNLFSDAPYFYADRSFLGASTANPLSKLLVCMRAARLHQWVKNSLIFVPLLLGHQFAHRFKLANAAIAFLSLSLCASSLYLLNDLLDLEADRAHVRKRYRPFASGELGVVTGFGLILIGLGACAVCAWQLPVAAAQLIAVYAVVNFLYSAFLKRFLFLDTVTLAFLYTLRILLGGSATHIEVSVWTLAFSVFFFLGLALLKRVVELVSAKPEAPTSASRRAYTAADLASVNSFASSALFISVLITVLYINSPDVVRLYRHPQFLWLISLPLLYWIGRLLTLANRGLLTDDPIVFAFRDKASYLVGIAVLVCAYLAT
jgi:4-hydroxybenzoate polyprenyltransferase